LIRTHLEAGPRIWLAQWAVLAPFYITQNKRLLKTFGSSPAGYTHDDLERFLDLLYGMFSDVYTMVELRQIIVSDPFDRSEHPRQLKLVELTDWLEVLVA
jgi:hypothetical protein